MAYCKEFVVKTIISLFIIFSAFISILEGSKGGNKDDIKHCTSIICGSISSIVDIWIILSAPMFVQNQKDHDYLFVLCFAIYNLFPRNIIVIAINIQVMVGIDIEDPDYGIPCKIEAFLINYAGLSVFWLMTMIAIMIIGPIKFPCQIISSCMDISWNRMAILIRKQMGAKQNWKRKLLKIMKINVPIPLLFSIIPFITQSYGANGNSCNILKDDHHKSIRILCYYGHIMISIVTSLFAILITTIRMNSCNAADRKIQRKWDKFKTYIWILILSFSMAAIRRTMQDFYGMTTDKDEFLVEIILLHRLTAGLFGFNMFLYHGRFGKYLHLKWGWRIYIFESRPSESSNNADMENQDNEQNNSGATGSSPITSNIDGSGPTYDNSHNDSDKVLGGFNEENLKRDTKMDIHELQQVEIGLLDVERTCTKTKSNSTNPTYNSHLDSVDQDLSMVLYQ